MIQIKGFTPFSISRGTIVSCESGVKDRLVTISGFERGSNLILDSGLTHFGILTEGYADLRVKTRQQKDWTLYAEDYFCVSGVTMLSSNGVGIVISISGYNGQNMVGGPIEEVGRLKYIDGCTDSILVPPVELGDPCLNYLHFPPGIIQTQHTHPSIRAGLILRGKGECISRGETIALIPGTAFVLPPHIQHAFRTYGSSMDVIAFHPDSDVGPTDEKHPMITRTIVDGRPASEIKEIRSK